MVAVREAQVCCRGNERWFDLECEEVYFLHFHKEFQGRGRKVGLLYEGAGFGWWSVTLLAPQTASCTIYVSCGERYEALCQVNLFGAMFGGIFTGRENIK